MLIKFNVYQINLYQHNGTHKCNNKQIPGISHDVIEKPIHQYSTRFAKTNFSLKKFSLSTTKYLIYIQEPKVWNDFFANEQKRNAITLIISIKN